MSIISDTASVALSMPAVSSNAKSLAQIDRWILRSDPPSIRVVR